MARYVLAHKRAGKFTDQEKVTSRASVAQSLSLLGNPRILADHQPSDPHARRVTLIEMDAHEAAKVSQRLPPDAILEPAVQRRLHAQRILPRLRPMPLTDAHLRAARSHYSVSITAGGRPLSNAEVMFYVSGPGRSQTIRTLQADGKGAATLPLPAGLSVSYVEPIPESGFWIMLVEAPASGRTIDCVPIQGSQNGGGWWHQEMGIDLQDAKRGAGIKVGIIDTGCGPHPNLTHVTLAGVFVDGQVFPGNGATDVAQHGTHTSGIVGSRTAHPGEYQGLAPGCDLFHARVFQSEEQGPTQADIINAIDELSRNRGCDLINMSLGGGPPSAAEEDAILDATERGTLCICSAGNEAGPIDYPAAYPECAAVSAIGKIGWAPPGTFSAGNRPQDPNLNGDDQLFLAAFSCFGSRLTCCAPGVGIVSTVPAKVVGTSPYMEMDGTSMASPAACGALAVILAKDSVYVSLPRDRSRYLSARKLLVQHCETIGLESEFEGRGLPHV